MFRIRHRPAALAAALVLAVVPVACGSDENADGVPKQFQEYCGAMKKYQEIFADDGTGLGLVTNIPKLEKLEKVAPDDLQDEWQSFLSALEGLRNAITAVGLKPTDFVNAMPPVGLTKEDQAIIAAAADRLAQDDVAGAAAGIEQQAKDVCKLQLGL
ncbi:hypothetical protein ABIE44_003640 [Marmoricola sp. OAE513]|uniref:hypothetical protein n=1 Tax=Marmoricola sp. OAE513 TaxID=2817894 RepID=UPI001AE81340